MTPDEAAAAILAIDKDTELAHIEADNILRQFLRDAGLGVVSEAWEQLERDHKGFWYA